MFERNITLDEARQVVDDPDTTLPRRDGKLSYIKTIGGRRIKVVLADDSNPPTLVTVIEEET
jgi:hypothetical protein